MIGNSEENITTRVLTFDIEDWFHLLDNESTQSEQQWAHFESRLERNTVRILELLGRKQQKATFFCLGWVGTKYPEIVRQIVKAGHDVGSHSHAHQLVYHMTPKAFRTDIQSSISVLEDLAGAKIRSFRAPGFSIRSSETWAFEVLAECGIELDSSVFPASRAHGGYQSFGASVPSRIMKNGIEIREFPMNLSSIAGKSFVFSGGGYFRLLPYSLIRHLIRRSSYIMTYFHPRDFDPHQPMVPGLPLSRQFKSYVGLRSAFSKLERMLGDFEHCSLVEAEAKIDWSRAPAVSL